MKPKLSTLALAALLATLTGSAQAQLRPRDGSALIAVAEHRVEARIDDGLARTTVRQTFVSQHARPLEAVFEFALPEGAALIDVAMEVDGQRLEGLLAERRRARAVYDEIVRGQRDPALVEQVAHDRFRLSVFPVVPEVETVVELSWIQHAPLANGILRYVYPLPKEGAQRLSANVHVRSSASLSAVRSPSSEAYVVQFGAHEALASWESSGESLRGELVVLAEVVEERARLDVHTLPKAEGGGGWFLAVVTPPAVSEEQLLPRDLVLVVDTSGSMSGEGKIEQARSSTLWMLDHLRPQDRVNVLRFSSDVEPFAPGPVPATPENLEQLRAFVSGFRAQGGTALGDALQAATDSPATPGRARSIVVLSDGQASVGEQRLVELVAMARAAGERGQRIFPFGVGADVDAALLRGVAAASHGRAELFLPGAELESRLRRFLTRMAAPVIGDLSLEVEGVAVHDLLPRRLPEAYLGEQVTICGRYRGAGPGAVKLRGVLGGEEIELNQQVVFAGEAEPKPFVAQMYARQKLDALEQARRLRLGLADDAYYTALDRGAYSTEDEIVAEMIEVSLGHGVQCAYTSFLVLLPEDRARLDPRDIDALARAEERARALTGREAGAGEALLGALDVSGGSPDFVSDSPFDSQAFNDMLGIGGGAGGARGGRRVGRVHRGVDPVEEPSLKDALDAQADASPESPFDSDAFHEVPDIGGGAGAELGARRTLFDEALQREPEDRLAIECARATSEWLGLELATSVEGVDARGLALSALLFLEGGSSVTEGPQHAALSQCLRELRELEAATQGWIDDSLEVHALATFALCEGWRLSRSPLLRRSARSALEPLFDPGLDWSAQSGEALGWSLLAQDAGEALFASQERTVPNPLGVEARRRGERPEATALDRIVLLLAPTIRRGLDAWPTVLQRIEAGGDTLSLDALALGSYAASRAGVEHWRAWRAVMRGELADELGEQRPWQSAAALPALDRLTRRARVGLALHPRIVPPVRER